MAETSNELPLARRAIVYRYGCDAPIAGFEYAAAERERCAALWNELVRIERTIESELLQRACLDDAETMQLTERIAMLSACLAANPDDKTVRDERGKCYAARRERLRAWNKAQKNVLREYEQRRQRSVKLARQQTDAWWPNYNRTLQSYETARVVCRQSGRRLREYDETRDDGVLTYQIQRTPSGLGAAPGELMDGTVSALQIGATSRPGRRSRLMDFRVDAEGHVLRIPVYWHRELPDGSRVKSAQITWGRRGGKLRWALCLTVSTESPALREPTARPAVVQFHWERAGGLKVLSVNDGGAMSHWALPPRWLHRADLIAYQSAQIDETIEAGRARWGTDSRLSAILAARPMEMMGLLQARWDILPKDAREWYRGLSRAWRARDGLRAHVLGERRDLYRQFAREVVRRWPVIALPELDLAAIATAEKGEERNSDRHLAALHTLRGELLHQAAKAGCLVVASADVARASGDRKSARWVRLKNLARERSHRASQAA